MTVHADSPMDDRAAQSGQALARKPLGLVRTDGSAGAAAELVVVAGNERGQRFRLAGGTLVAGRSERADLRFSDPAIDGEHFRFVRDGDVWLVQSLDQRPVHVNEIRATEYTLRDGDRVRVGRTVLKLLATGDLEDRYVEESFRATVVDAVTRLWTRDAMLEAVRVEQDHARRFSLPMSLLVLRFDGFDLVDADDVLRWAGSRVKTILSRQDRIGRLDDRTIAVLLPRTTPADAAAVGDRLCEGLRDQQVPTESGPVSLRTHATVGAPGVDEAAEVLLARLVG